MKYRLSKSRYVRSLQCDKALYLDTFCPHLAAVSEQTRELFAKGRLFERKYKDQFPDAVDLMTVLGRNVQSYADYTHKLLQSNKALTIFEAGFVYNSVLVLTDVLERTPDGRIIVNEVKNSNAVKPVFIDDASVQYYIVCHSLGHIDTFNLITHDEDGSFVKTDITERLIERQLFVEQQVAHCFDVLGGTMPLISLGEHCYNPYVCPYMYYCAHPQGQIELQVS